MKMLMSLSRERSSHTIIYTQREENRERRERRRERERRGEKKKDRKRENIDIISQ